MRIGTETWIPDHFGKSAEELLKKYGFKQEEAEEVRFGPMTKTSFPKPERRYRLINESYKISLEESYFWIMNYVKMDFDYPEFHKISDVFSSAENSAFFGVNQQRLGLQQDKVSQFLATIGKMIKELFQIVRELRILDERVDLYNKSYENFEAAEISLKGYWIDLVEGGAKNPASVYGMSRDLGFLTLPDLFFGAPKLEAEEVDKYVNNLDFNRKVKEVLKRKLFTFAQWKRHTFDELKSRRVFTLKYLRQHYAIIKMYMTWVKPYLRNVKRLNNQDYTQSVHLVAAFEGSLIEVEWLAVKPMGGGYNACINGHFFFRVRPEMSYQQEGFQRGPLHVGRMEVNLRGYAWTDNQVKNYLKYREEEERDLLKDIDETVKAAYEALGDELEGYLNEAEYGPARHEAAKEDKNKPSGVVEPFVSVFKGAGELVTAITGVKGNKHKKSKKNVIELLDAKNKAKEWNQKAMWNAYDKYKKSHKLLSW